MQLIFELGMDTPPLPLSKPWPVKDKMHAAGAAVSLRYFLDPGKTEGTVQF
jgi:hypothetical protein